MPGLLDVAPLHETVSVNGTSITVDGLSAADIAILLQRFPDLRKLFAGREVVFDLAHIAQLAPALVAAIIAAGTGAIGDEKTEARAAQLPLETQVEFLDKIVKLTMPGGVGPFVEKVVALFEGLADAPTSIPVTRSRQPSKPS